MPDQIYVLITVNLLEGAISGREDINDDGEDGIVGAYGFILDSDQVAGREVEEGDDPAIETALDIFHNEIGISELDNYDILPVRIASMDEAPDTASWR